MEEYKDQLDSEEVSKMREKITEVRDKLANKDEMDPEEIKSTVSDLQQSSLKLFEVAYKKVRQRDSNTSTSLEFHKPHVKSTRGCELSQNVSFYIILHQKIVRIILPE